MIDHLFSTADKRKQAIRYAITVVVSVLFILIGNRIATKNAVMFSPDEERIVVTAKVTDVISRNVSMLDWAGTELEHTTILFRADILSGRWKGSSVTATQVNEPFYPIQLREVSQGDRVILTFTQQPDEETGSWLLQEYNRVGPLVVLGGAFILFAILFGRTKGLNTILSLTFTCLALFLIFIPSILSGHNIYLATYIVCIYVITMTLSLVNGINRKSFAAGIGCLSGLATAGLLIAVMDRFLKLSGYLSEESVYLMNLDTPSPINLKAIIFASIIIGALGATMDVSVSIASSLSEIYETTGGKLSYRDIIRSGLNIGRDIMGTMSNTLVLAYVGSGMSLLLLFVVYANSFIELINRESVVVELLQALIGSLGLILTIPLTSIVFGFFIKHKEVAAAATEGEAQPKSTEETGQSD